MAWNTGLTGKPLEIARWPTSPLRVMAGPGTGKSFAMKRRVARLLEEGADPDRILAVTFTRNAAGSLLNDLRALGVPGCGDIHCGTLHSFCFALLNREDAFRYLGRKTRPLVTFKKRGGLRFEAEPMVEDLCHLGLAGGKKECNKAVLAYEAAWARLQTDEPGWAPTPTDEAFENALVAWLTFHEAMLIGEVVPEALKFIRGNPGCSALQAYDHVIVDEYQDLNKAEQTLLDMLAVGGNLAIVGDVDQSIYSFRHANPEGITDFATTRPATHDESLEECRRCPQRVVRLAATLIKHNHPPGAPTRLSPKPGNPDGEVYTVQWPSFDAEATGIAEYIKSLVDGGHPPGEILVLTPRRLIGYAIRDALVTEGVTVHSYYHEESLEDKTAQEAFCLLSLLAQPDDRPALRWWLGYGSGSWRSGRYAVLRRHCETSGESPRTALERLSAGTLTLPRSDQLVERYRELKDRLKALEGASIEVVMNALFPDGEEWATGLRELAADVAPKCTKISEFKDRMTTGITQPEMPTGGDFVRLMSLHKSKGLTSRTVVVAGCIAGYIPTEDEDETPARQAELLREQRRLFYVAITRCTERLLLSSAQQIERSVAMQTGATLGRRGGTVASKFFHELGPEQPRSVQGSRWQAARYK